MTGALASQLNDAEARLLDFKEYHSEDMSEIEAIVKQRAPSTKEPTQ